ncbi:MAG: rhodanese-like domain-containing protein [Opitutae bacterium]|jgi:rhodanese-related sulfurtransferase|nr:rhodanese-like domain-containing protein [Opitutae bacterium]
MDIEITVMQAEELREKNPSIQFLDVREPEEVEIGHIKGTLHIPLNLIPHNLEKIPQEEALIVYCHHGMRSLKAVEYLKAKGFDKAINLAGGIHEWSTQIDPTIPTY